MEHPIKMGLFGGTPIFGNIHIYIYIHLGLYTPVNWCLKKVFKRRGQMKFKSKQHGKTWNVDGFAFYLRPNCWWRPFALWKPPSVRFFVEVSNVHLFHSNCLKCVPCCAMLFFVFLSVSIFQLLSVQADCFFCLTWVVSNPKPHRWHLQMPRGVASFPSTYVCFQAIFYGFYHDGKSPLFTTIWGFFLFLSTKQANPTLQDLMGEWSTSSGRMPSSRLLDAARPLQALPTSNDPRAWANMP